MTVKEVGTEVFNSENRVGTIQHSQRLKYIEESQMSSICFANSVSQHLKRLNYDECSHKKANTKIVIKHNEERVDVA
ncbi:hypothetical protein CUS07_02150 [Enterococcus faecalis]|nr:hypothetical protein CUS33_03520 [Enterococcus faecalis]PQE61248.1 hypothetical protein CUS07_02150 [Enterococcus faecalis]PQE65101.1 hypothetical protein CUS03_10410 [Enterococcus faecalis]PQF00436.1 hypothetical protein CUS90_03625 [Enterococcus faecalis]PQF54386.1 hypothetical protein CUS66_09940 [Enterococcus faecalis]